MKDSPQNSGEFCFEMRPSELIIYYVVPKRIRRVFCLKLIVRECAKALNCCLALMRETSGEIRAQILIIHVEFSLPVRWKIAGNLSSVQDDSEAEAIVCHVTQSRGCSEAAAGVRARLATSESDPFCKFIIEFNFVITEHGWDVNKTSLKHLSSQDTVRCDVLCWRPSEEEKKLKTLTTKQITLMVLIWGDEFKSLGEVLLPFFFIYFIWWRQNFSEQNTKPLKTCPRRSPTKGITKCRRLSLTFASLPTIWCFKAASSLK